MDDPPKVESQPDASVEPTSKSPSDPKPEPSVYAPCADELRWGQFFVRLEPKYSAVQGTIYNGVDPQLLMEPSEQKAGCTFFKPRIPSCDPPCAPTERCNDAGTCVPAPRAQDAGTVRISGMAQDLELEARPPIQLYSHQGTLPHPVTKASDRVSLVAQGAQIPAFELHAFGVDALQGVADKVDIVDGQDLNITWTGASSPEKSKVLLSLNINKHGGPASKILCVAEDTGTFTIPAAMVKSLRDEGVSGYPGLTLARQSVASTSVESGCVELVVQSETSLEVAIPGLVSCSDDSDCPDGQSCQDNLTCA